MYLKDKKTVTIGEKLKIDKTKHMAKAVGITSTGNFLIKLYESKLFYYFMGRDFKVRGTENSILFGLKTIKKIKYKRKRYKNG